MITWRCSLFALALVPACGTQDGMGFLPLVLRGGAPERAAELAGGDVSLTAPTGYCVDPRTLQAKFAALARCDTLGGPASFQPLAVITVTVAQTAPGDDSAADAMTPDGSAVMARRDTAQLSLQQLRGPTLGDGFSDVSWRGAGQLDDYAVSLALYAPQDGEASGAAGAQILTEVMSGLTRTEGAAPVPKPRQENGLGPLISGLFN